VFTPCISNFAKLQIQTNEPGGAYACMRPKITLHCYWSKSATHENNTYGRVSRRVKYLGGAARLSKDQIPEGGTNVNLQPDSLETVNEALISSAAIMANVISLTTSYTPTITAAGPLTTVWTPPSFCGNAVLSGCSSYTGSDSSYTTTCPYIERDHTCGSDGRPTRASSCFPPDADPSGVILYSPGVECPVGWTVAVRTLDPASSITVTCCPS
jgi:hypothetical protein